MKIRVPNYTFNKTAKTVTFTDYGSITLDRVVLITNVTRNIIIYNFADPLKGGTVATNVLTLTFDTSAQADADKLLIYYEDENATQSVTGALTDTQLRATPVPVSGSVTTGGLTDAQLRATAVPVSNASLPLPAGAATETTLSSVLTSVDGLEGKDYATETTLAALNTKIPASPATAGNQATGNASLASIDGKDFATQTTLALIKAKTDNIDVLLSTRTKPADTQPISAASLPLPADASTETTLALIKAKTDNLDVLLSTRLKPADTLTGITTVAAVTAITNALPAGNNNIGDVDVLTLPALPAGTNNIGGVDVLTLPANATVDLNRVAGTAVAAGSGVITAGTQRIVLATDQPTVPVSFAAATALYRGRVSTFSTPGRAGTVGQKIFAIHNATGSTRVVTINSIAVDLVQLAAIAVTVRPVIVRIYRVTVLPTNGTALTKVARDTDLSASGSITVFGDASADGTGSGTTLTATLPAANVLTQTYAARLITAAGYEPFDREVFLDGAGVKLKALEGLVVMLDYTLTTQNPTTNQWLVTCEWDEA